MPSTDPSATSAPGTSPDSDEPVQDTAVDQPEREPDLVDLGLPEPLVRAVLDLGYVRPTRIQAAAVPALLQGRDLTGVARTGTGKTAAFGLPLLAAVDPARREVQAVVLTPTRELAAQVADALTAFAAHLPRIEVVAVYGGAPFLPQRRAIADGAQVVVGTPGRVIDHLERRSLDLGEVRFMVLDEADEMLRMGFAEDVDTIFGHVPARRQVALFSATMPPAIVQVAGRHLNDPVRIAVSPSASTVPTVRQTYAVVPHRHKIGALTRVLATSDADAAIVFTRTRERADEVGAALVQSGVSAATISGDVPQKDREKIVERLRGGSLDVLVATDVAARGLDVDRIGLVVNLDAPGEPEAYVHRIGRTGRAGRAGQALTFLTPNERGRLKAIERATRSRLEEVTVPTPADVSAHRLAKVLDRVADRIAAGRLDLYRAAATEYLEQSGIAATDLVAALAAMCVGDDGPAARDQEDLAPAPGQQARGASSDPHGRVSFVTEGPARTKAGRPVRGGGTRYRVAVGHEHGARPEAIVGAITGEGGLRGKDIGKIDIFAAFSLVEITAELTPAILHRISTARVGGRALRISVDRGATARPGHGSRAGHRGTPAARTADGGRPRRDTRGGQRRPLRSAS